MFSQAKSKPLNVPHMSGITLIEVMVSLAIGLIVVAAIGYVFLGSKQTYRTQDVLARLQEGARYAFETMDYDIRMAGYPGCDFKATRSSVLNGTDWYGQLFDQPLVGYESGSGMSGLVNNNLSGRDAIAVVRADESQEYLIASHAPPVITLSATHDIVAGDLLAASDCQHIALFQASGVATNTVSHDVTASAPGNCTINLGTKTTPGVCNTGVVHTYLGNDRLLKVKAVLFFLRNNASNEPSLYRQRLLASGGDADTQAEELIDGIEDMQITYGADTDATADGEPNQYLTATQVVSTVPGATNADKWKRVHSVKVALLMRTVEDNVATAAQTYLWDTDSDGAMDDSVLATDRRIRKAFTHVIAVRNR